MSQVLQYVFVYSFIYLTVQSITRWLWHNCSPLMGQFQFQRHQIISWRQLISKHCFAALLRFEHRIEAVIHMRCNIIWKNIFFPIQLWSQGDSDLNECYSLIKMHKTTPPFPYFSTTILITTWHYILNEVHYMLSCMLQPSNAFVLTRTYTKT